MTNFDIYAWVAVIVISLIIEFTTMDITSIWFSIGGVVALILAAFSVMAEIQVVVFIIVSATLLLTLRRWAKNKLLSSSNEPTNLDLLKQEKVKLLSPITENEKGTVKLNGVVWNAVSQDGAPIEENSFVKVVEVKGNKLIVKKEIL